MRLIQFSCLLYFTKIISSQLNFNAEYGTRCTYIYDGLQCSGNIIAFDCQDLAETETCTEHAPINRCVVMDADQGYYQNTSCLRWDGLGATTEKPTTTTTTATTLSEQECIDTTWEEDLGYLLWTDEWNFTCADYEKYNWCSALVNYNYSRNERGCTAAQACCVCGGGTTGNNPFVHEDRATEKTDNRVGCIDYDYNFEMFCRSTDDIDGGLCLLNCQNIWQSFCATSDANKSGFSEGNLSAREACCMCGGGNQPPEPYLVYDTETCTIFSFNITPGSTSDVLYDDDGYRYRIAYSNYNPPSCWTAAAFIIFGIVSVISFVIFVILRIIDSKRNAKISYENRNRLPRQSVMEKNVQLRKRELFEADQKHEEDIEVERQRVLRENEADAWITKAKEATSASFVEKQQRAQSRRNETKRQEMNAAKIRQERLARIAAFEAQHGQDWEHKLAQVTPDSGAS